MRRSAQAALWAGLVLVLGVGAAPAQLNEIIRGAVNDVPTDMFDCRLGVLACDLGYRMYSETDSDEVNGPANPVDGNPRYMAGPRRYLSDAQTTANFPVSKGVQNANWYMVWDGVTDSGTADHAGWYGTQSQTVFSGDVLGSSTSFNCLPIQQEACWRALAVFNGFNDTTRANGSALLHQGGISPVPCPQIADNGLTDITFSWEAAANHTETDGAPSGIVGTSLYLQGNPTSPPTDLDWAAGGVLVARESGMATSTTVSRGFLNSLAGLEAARTYVAALKLDYATTPGKSAKSSRFSCNSAFTGTCLLRATEPGDAPAAVDIEEICLEKRTNGAGNRFLAVIFNMATANVKVNQIHYEVGFDDQSAKLIGFPASASRSKAGADVLFHDNSSFNAGDIVGNSSFDEVNGVVEMVVNLDELEAVVGSPVSISGNVRIPGPNRDDYVLGEIDLHEGTAP